MPPHPESIAVDGSPPAPAAANPYLFVVGCPRSGTTLLQRMLDHHPRLAVANDTHFIPRAVEVIAPAAWCDPDRAGALPLSKELLDWIRGYHRFPRLGLDAAAVERAAEAATYAQFVTALYDEYARQRGKLLAGEKTPDYARCLPLLHALFPWARTVHIIRDGRDVGLSLCEWAGADKGPGKLALWTEEPMAVSALWWRWQVTAARAAGAVLGAGDAVLGRARYLEVEYEGLVARPAERLTAIAAFLDLDPAAEMLAFHEGKASSAAAGSAKKAWLPPTPGLRDWRTQMGERDLALFEALAGDLLTDLGYPLASGALSSEISEVAAKCRAWWDAELARRQAKAAARRADQCLATPE